MGEGVHKLGLPQCWIMETLSKICCGICNNIYLPPQMYSLWFASIYISSHWYADTGSCILLSKPQSLINDLPWSQRSDGFKPFTVKSWCRDQDDELSYTPSHLIWTTSYNLHLPLSFNLYLLHPVIRTFFLAFKFLYLMYSFELSRHLSTRNFITDNTDMSTW